MKIKMFTAFLVLLACGLGLIVLADNHEEEENNKLVFPKAYTTMKVSDGGKITGVVKFEGEVPKMKKLDINKDKVVCGKTDKYDESVVVGESMELKNTIVYLMDITKGKDFDAKANKPEIDQEGCKFTPHVQIVPVGVRLTMLNNAPITHNVHIFLNDADMGQDINKQQNRMLKKLRIKSIAEAGGPVEVKCDIHSWMKAWIAYVPHPYFAVTDEKGEFTLEDVPPGTYKLGYWHEACGTNNKEPQAVTVTAGGEVKQDFTLKLAE